MTLALALALAQAGAIAEIATEEAYKQVDEPHR